MEQNNSTSEFSRAKQQINNEIFWSNIVGSAGALLTVGAVFSGMRSFDKTNGEYNGLQTALAGVGLAVGMGLSIIAGQRLNSANMDQEDLMQQRNALHLREQFGEKEGSSIPGLQIANNRMQSARWVERASELNTPATIAR